MFLFYIVRLVLAVAAGAITDVVKTHVLGDGVQVQFSVHQLGALQKEIQGKARGLGLFLTGWNVHIPWKAGTVQTLT